MSKKKINKMNKKEKNYVQLLSGTDLVVYLYNNILNKVRHDYIFCGAGGGFIGYQGAYP